MSARSHHTDSADCWCQPDLRQICPECEAADNVRASCWRCKADPLGAGWVAPYDDERTTVIIHRQEAREPTTPEGREASL